MEHGRRPSMPARQAHNPLHDKALGGKQRTPARPLPLLLARREDLSADPREGDTGRLLNDRTDRQRGIPWLDDPHAIARRPG